jgi:hypothetical protein
MKRTKWILGLVAVVFMLCSPAFAAAPNEPENPSPQVGEEGVVPTITLEWDCSDPDPGDKLTFEIWMRRVPYDHQGSPPYESLELYKVPMLVALKNVFKFTVESLTPDFTYVWQVRAIDLDSNETWGPRWHFTTLSDVTGIISITPNPAEARRRIKITGWGFRAGYPLRLLIGNRKFEYGESRRIRRWTGGKIVFKLPKYNQWPSDTSKFKTVSIEMSQDREIVRYEYDTPLEIYKP